MQHGHRTCSGQAASSWARLGCAGRWARHWRRRGSRWGHDRLAQRGASGTASRRRGWAGHRQSGTTRGILGQWIDTRLSARCGAEHLQLLSEMRRLSKGTVKPIHLFILHCLQRGNSSGPLLSFAAQLCDCSLGYLSRLFVLLDTLTEFVSLSLFECKLFQQRFYLGILVVASINIKLIL